MWKRTCQDDTADYSIKISILKMTEISLGNKEIMYEVPLKRVLMPLVNFQTQTSTFFFFSFNRLKLSSGKW